MSHFICQHCAVTARCTEPEKVPKGWVTLRWNSPTLHATCGLKCASAWLTARDREANQTPPALRPVLIDTATDTATVGRDTWKPARERDWGGDDNE